MAKTSSYRVKSTPKLVVPPPFRMAKTFSAPPFRRGKTSRAPPSRFVAPPLPVISDHSLKTPGALETFMGVDQRTGEGSKPRIPLVVSKSDRDHGTATTDNRNLGLTPAVTISRSNLSLSLYPIHSSVPPPI